MTPFLQKIKITSFELLHSPVQTSTRIYRKLLRIFAKKRIERLREETRRCPLILQIETINSCNAACIFCAYPGMKREKGVMSMPLFEKVVQDYAEMGGGVVSLTPIVGDPLLDPQLLDRIRILKAHPAIKQISFTTNGIALDRYSDEDVRSLLASLYCIQVSIGGLDAATYETMYGVDCFARVNQAMERLVELGTTVPQAAHLTFAFRTSDWKFVSRFKKQLAGYRRRGVFVSHMWTYANYGGLVGNDGNNNLTVLDSHIDKHRTCIYPSIHSAVCWDGTATACSCTDLECTQIRIGNAGEEPLSSILSGNKRTGILDSFCKGTPAAVCRECSAYRPDTVFADPYFRNVHPNQALPLDFFHHVMT